MTTNAADHSKGPHEAVKEYFETERFGSESFENINTSFKIIDRMSLAPFELNSSRDSLGILSNSLLGKESLKDFNININEALNQSDISFRESLGILNLSTLDLGRESVGLFNINKQVTKDLGKDEAKLNFEFNVDNFDFGSVAHGLEKQNFHKLPPEIVVSTTQVSDEDKVSSSNSPFILPDVATSSTFLNSKSFENMSKMFSPSFFLKETDPSLLSELGKTDPLNEAFQIVSISNQSVLPISSVNFQSPFLADVELLRKRIQSLPTSFENKNFGNFGNSFHEAMVCRGIEDNKDFDDSVFLEAQKVVTQIATSFVKDDTSDDSIKHNTLDAIPQPDWPEELDSSQSCTENRENPIKCDSEAILKKVNKMFGPALLEKTQNIKGDNKSDSSLENLSQNISRISRISQGSQTENNSYECASASNNMNNVSQLIDNLSFIINEKEDLSNSQRNEGHHLLHCLASMLRDSKKNLSSDDSGHSSVDNHPLEENKNMEPKESRSVEVSKNSDDLCTPLDLSCKGESCSSTIKRKVSLPKTFSPGPSNNPPPYLVKTPNRSSLFMANNASVGSNESNHSRNHSNGSNTSNASGKSVNTSSNRSSNIIQNKFKQLPAKLQKSHSGLTATKRGPLRAVLPIENMTKESKLQVKTTEASITPEKYIERSKPDSKLKRTSTPIHTSRPVAASTPTNCQIKNSKTHDISPLARPKFTRSFSHRSLVTSSSTKTETSDKSKQTSLQGKTFQPQKRNSLNEGLQRRNSVSEGTRTEKKYEGKLKRSFSTGKESRIMSALQKVRQNILSSGYHNQQHSESNVLINEKPQKASISTGNVREPKQEFKMPLNKIGKENLKP